MSQPVSSSLSEQTTEEVLPTVEQYSDGDLDLDVILQKMVADITGLPGDMVRPRWQPINPTYPEIGSNWCAIGITSQEGDANTATTVGSDDLISVHRHETLTLLSSFYGPKASQYAGRFRDGLMVGQNRAVLDSNGMAILRVGNIGRFPVLLNQQWQNRVDFQLTLRRHTIRTYPITTVIESDGTVLDTTSSIPFDTGVIS